MSVELFVYFKKTLIPTTEKLNTVLKFRKFDWKVEEDCNLSTQSGFMPVIHLGKRTGFEFDIAEAETYYTEHLPEDIKLGGRDAQANFRFHREDELGAAMPGAIALALLTQGIFYDPQEDSWIVDPTELNDKLDSLHPDHWQNRTINLVPNHMPPKIDFKKVKVLLGKHTSRMKPFPNEYADKKVDGVSLMEISVLPVAMIHQISEAESLPPQLLIGPIFTVGRAIPAIDRVLSALSGNGKKQFEEIRAFYLEVLTACDTQIKP